MMNEIMITNQLAKEAKYMSNLYLNLSAAIKNRDARLVIELAKEIENLRIEIERSLLIDL